MLVTFDVPFESVHAAQNIALAREKIPATFVLDADDDNIKQMMREVFNRAVQIGVIDAIIEPSQTRRELIRAIAEAPQLKGTHANIPL